MTEPSLQTLTRRRNELVKFFKEKAKRQGFRVTPSRDTRLLNLCRRLYDETRNGRRFIVDVNEDNGLSFDWFVKSVPVETVVVDMLAVFVRSETLDMNSLWSIYVHWIHEKRAAPDIPQLHR